MTTESFDDPQSVETEQVLNRFNQVFQDHNPEDLQKLVADDCIVENSTPAPDGSRHEGKAACIELWTRIATDPKHEFETENVVARGDRGEIRWRLAWGPAPGDSVRGVNLMRVRGGQIVEARGYVKSG